MVRYLMGGLVIGLLFGGGMNTILADENEVTITRTEYETLLQQVQDTKSDTEKILEILEGKQTNEAKEGGESEETPSSYSRSGGEVNDTNDNDSGEEGVSDSEAEEPKAEEVDKEVDKEEEIPTDNTMFICESCLEENITSKAYEEGQRECDSCKNKPKVEVDEEPPTQEPPTQEGEDIPQLPQIETTICPTCEQEYTVGAYHECPQIRCNDCGEWYPRDNSHTCPIQYTNCPSCGTNHPSDKIYADGTCPTCKPSDIIIEDSDKEGEEENE